MNKKGEGRHDTQTKTCAPRIIALLNQLLYDSSLIVIYVTKLKDPP